MFVSGEEERGGQSSGSSSSLAPVENRPFLKSECRIDCLSVPGPLLGRRSACEILGKHAGSLEIPVLNAQNLVTKAFLFLSLSQKSLVPAMDKIPKVSSLFCVFAVPRLRRTSASRDTTSATQNGLLLIHRHVRIMHGVDRIQRIHHLLLLDSSLLDLDGKVPPRHRNQRSDHRRNFKKRLTL